MKRLAPIAVVLLLAGCTTEAPEESPKQAAARVDPENPCDLLTESEVEAAVESEVRSVAEVGAILGKTRICSYKTGKPWASVGILFEDNISSEDFDKEMGRDPLNTEPVDDVGDGAFIHGCASIIVYVSDFMVTASIQHLTTCEETAVVLKALGRTIVGTLDQTL